MKMRFLRDLLSRIPFWGVSVKHQDSAYLLGVKDALSGELCLPEVYFSATKAQKKYAMGYHSIRPSLLSAQILGGMR